MNRSVWLGLSVTAALLVVGGVVLVNSKKRQPATTVTTTTADAGGCRVERNLSLMPLLAADDPPVILWATGDVRLELNGALAFAPPDSPITLKSASHKLEVDGQAAGREETSFRVLRSRPAFFFAAVLPEEGLVLVRNGTLCESCEAPTGSEELEFAARRDSTNYLLKESAKVLRSEKWTEARELLRGVPPKDRKREEFRLIAAALFGQANQGSHAMAQLEALAKQKPKSSVAQLLQQFEGLKLLENARREKVLLQRWNKLTERFSALVAKFEPQVRGVVEAHSRRLEALSEAYGKAAQTHDLATQEELVAGALGLLEEFVEQIRAQRPDDCEFQTKVVAAALQ